MKNNETGEFELVLGNKQLLSGFFIVVILFGVFFTMGYIVGRNSAPSGRMTASADSTGTPLAAGGQPDTRPQPATSAAPAPPPSGDVPGQPGQPGEQGAAPGQPATAQPAAAAESPAPAPAASAPETTSAKPATAAAPAPNGLIEPDPADVYLQVLAAKRAEAEVVQGTLRAKNFRTVLAQGPNQLVRVLVGPFTDTAGLGQAKAGLENAGFRPFKFRSGEVVRK
jgi:cell division protein FtsN